MFGVYSWPLWAKENQSRTGGYKIATYINHISIGAVNRKLLKTEGERN